MKAISAAIVVFSGAIVLAAGSHVHHGDTSFVVSGIGCLVICVGIVGWWQTLSKQD